MKFNIATNDDYIMVSNPKYEGTDNNQILDIDIPDEFMERIDKCQRLIRESKGQILSVKLLTDFVNWGDLEVYPDKIIPECEVCEVYANDYNFSCFINNTNIEVFTY